MDKYVKYPRTFHFPFSPGASNDDRILKNIEHFKDKRIIITEKLDGENTSLYNDHLHARSLSSGHHPSRSWIKQFHDNFRHDIPNNFRVCGENLFAKHSIFYDSLPSYFLAFSIWEDDRCLSWDETNELCQLLGVSLVPVLYDGKWDEEIVKSCWTGVSKYGPDQEGYVVRIADSFFYEEFEKSVVKFVSKEFREQLNSKSIHWMTAKVIPNLLHND